MEKILVHLSVPSVGVEYDAFVPGDLAIEKLIGVLASGVSDLSSGRYESSGRESLIARDPSRLLDPEKTLHDYGLHDGAGLMLL